MKMGDRTGVTVTIKSSDISEFIACASETENFQDLSDEEVFHSDGNKTVSIDVQDVNWFGMDDIYILSNAGLTFLYEHNAFFRLDDEPLDCAQIVPVKVKFSQIFPKISKIAVKIFCIISVLKLCPF
jgi:hypothetical protein